MHGLMCQRVRIGYYDHGFKSRYVTSFSVLNSVFLILLFLIEFRPVLASSHNDSSTPKIPALNFYKF